MNIIRRFNNFIENKINRPLTNRIMRGVRLEDEETESIENNLDLYDIKNDYHRAVNHFMKSKTGMVFLNRYKHKALDTIISAIDNSEDEIFIYLNGMIEIYDRDFISKSIKNYLLKNDHSKIHIISKYLDNDIYVFNELKKLQRTDIYNDRIILFKTEKEKDDVRNIEIDPYGEDYWNEDLNDTSFIVKNIIDKNLDSSVLENINIYMADDFFLRIENMRGFGSSYNTIHKGEYEDKYKNLVRELKSYFLQIEKPVN